MPGFFLLFIVWQVGRKIILRSDRERARDSYPYSSQKGRNPRSQKHAGASLGFCWGFGIVVCLTFGLASFLMFSAGHFSFSPDTGVSAAWGDNEDNFLSSNLITIEITDIEANLKDPIEREGYLASRPGSVIDEFGPLPKYLSDYESIILNASDTGKTMPKNDDDDEDEAEFIQAVAAAQVSQPEQVQNAQSDDWMTAQEVCKCLKIGLSTLRRNIKAGVLPQGFEFSPRTKRWRMSDIVAYQRRRCVEESSRTPAKKRGRPSRIRKVQEFCYV